jgi:hypothetical protein
MSQFIGQPNERMNKVCAEADQPGTDKHISVYTRTGTAITIDRDYRVYLSHNRTDTGTGITEGGSRGNGR